MNDRRRIPSEKNVAKRCDYCNGIMYTCKIELLAIGFG